MADPGWLSMGDPAGSVWATLGGSASPTPVAQYRVAADSLYVHDIDGVWAAMLVADGQAPSEPGTLKGLGFFGDTGEEAEDAAKTHLGRSEPTN